MKKASMITLSTSALLLTAFGAVSLSLAGFATGGRRQTVAEALAWQREHASVEWFDPSMVEPYTVTSYDGYTLQSAIVRCSGPTDRYVILSHGYTDNRFGNLKYMKIYLDAGFNCIIYDLRGHGVNAKAPCTYSVRESKDLLAVIRDARQRFGEGITLGLHGESLGAATTIGVLRYEQDLSFAVADCGFAEIISVLQKGLAGMHLPQWLVYPASWGAKLRCGYAFTDMTPVDALADNTVPVLFIHGADDDFIVPDHSRRMQAATKGYSQLHLIPDAGHAQSVLMHPDLYRTYVNDFLQKIREDAE